MFSGRAKDEKNHQKKHVIIKITKKGKEVLQTHTYSLAMFLSETVKKGLYALHTRGASPLSSFLRKGSITVEMALVLPLFLISCFVILSITDMLRSYTETEQRLHQAARTACVYGSAAESVITGRDGDFITLSYVYPVSPAVKAPGFHTLLLKNQCRVHLFNGYDESGGDNVSSQEEQYVYITQSGSVYHRKRSCRFLSVAVQEAALSDIGSRRNKDGEKYYSCSKCSHAVKKSNRANQTVFIAEYGNRYHTSILCYELKRTVRVIHLSETGGRPACRECGL